MTPPQLSLADRLGRWGSPVPPGQEHLRLAFEGESLEALQGLLTSIYLALMLFFACFVVTDWLIYREVFWQLLPLRAALVGAYAVAWRTIRLLRGGGQTLAYMTAMFGVATAPIAGMIIVNGDPAGIYATPFVAGPAVLALLPMPLIWYAADTTLLTALYITAMGLSGHLGDPRVLNFVVALMGGSVLFGFFHVYLARQRWESFANRVRAEGLGERLASELAMARRIQQSLLPPATPRWPAPDLACWSGPAREVGGDFYAYARLADGRIGVSVGDVSGKGLPAALLVSTCLALLRSASEAAPSPSALLATLDRALADSTRVTRQNCALCCVELEGAWLRAANAGGVAPLLRRADGRVEWVEVGGLPLGTALGGAGYGDVCVEVGPGDTLIIVSDGVLEAMDASGRIFGFERLESAAAAMTADDAFAAVAELREAVAFFTGPADAHDDMTIVALRV